MTARRPPRISDCGYEIQLEDSDSSPENDARTRSTLSSSLSDSPTKFHSTHSSTPVHPLLTNFGPASATEYFRQALESLRLESSKEGKGKERATSLFYDQSQHRKKGNTRMRHMTMFDDDDDDDDEAESEAEDDDSEDAHDALLATGDDANMFRAGYGIRRPRTAAWSEDQDVYPIPRMRNRNSLRLTTSRGGMDSDIFSQPLKQTSSMSSSGPLAVAPPQLSDLDKFPSLPSALPPSVARRPTLIVDSAERANVLTRSHSAERHEILPSSEDSTHQRAPTTGNKGCRCGILCFCGADELEKDLSPLWLPQPTTKRVTRSSPAKARPGRLHGTPPNPNQLELHLARHSAAASVPTEKSATLKKHKANRSLDFEEHATEKRKSWRAGGEWRISRENDLSGDGSDLSEAGSMSYLSASTSGRLRRLPAQKQSHSATFDHLIGRASRQIGATEPKQIDTSTRQSIHQALNGINDEISAGLPDGGSKRVPTYRTVPSRHQDVAGFQSLSAYSNEENSLGTSLLFEESDDEEAGFYSLRRRPQRAESVLRSARRRRAAFRGYQLDPTTIGNENTPASSHSPLHVSKSAKGPSIGPRSSFKASPTSTQFDYADLTPQQLPRDIFARHSDARSHAVRRQKATPRSLEGTITHRNRASSRGNRASNDEAAIAVATSDLPLLDRELKFPRRTWDLSPLHASPDEPPVCPLGSDGRGWPDKLPVDIFILITKYLSHQDVCNLRLVNSTFESILVPVVFRSVVTRFGRSMFDVNLGKWEKKPPEGSIFEKYGMEIHKFGISFEIDIEGLQIATPKVIQNTQSSWWGKYTWPVPKYPRFKSLESLENLADHLPLLRSAFKDLTSLSELAICVDSGHGWLNGPDMSDFAVWNLRCSKGVRMFGRTFQAEDIWHQYGRNELFKWAQLNSINEALKSLLHGSNVEQWTPESRFLRSVAIRDIYSYALQNDQANADPDRHTGGTVLPTNPHAFNAQHQQMFQQAGLPNWPWQGPPAALHNMNMVPNPVNVHGMTRATHHGNLGRQNVCNHVKKGEVSQPQWPIIYNGYNVTAETGGHCSFVQKKLADPRTFPLCPGHLTEAQAQWLMETVWAQRAFLSAYTTAILTNKANFKQVHSLHIAKISSGLLPSLEQRELWQALPGLRTLKVLVSPDWRTEYMPGDQSFQTNMLTSPAQASIKFAEFLQRYVLRIEHLSTLIIGFVGGGEHATGLLARNQHVLPAPVTFDPRSWLTDHVTKPNLNTMIAFNHIKNLSIENAWVSPCMLDGFMTKSKDTSLRHLTLDSVSLTGVNSQRTTTTMTTLEDGLKPEYAPAAWLQERLPSEHCWPAVIDRLTPGVTFSKRKYDAGLIDPIQFPPPEPTFRGNVEKLTFKSCGYVKISGIPQTEFNQNGLVMPNTTPRDHGLSARENLLREARGLGDSNGNTTASVMMREKDPQGHAWFGLGKLTQCIHPIEKRVLEEAWQMKFGWGDDIERFGAVEDGCFEGGTGRFSGVVTK